MTDDLRAVIRVAEKSLRDDVAFHFDELPAPLLVETRTFSASASSLTSGAGSVLAQAERWLSMARLNTVGSGKRGRAHLKQEWTADETTLTLVATLTLYGRGE
jgi:hypothetical protein